jgi:hypothetical protein
MANYISNAFSLSMIMPIPPQGRTVKVRPVSLEEVKSLLQGGEFKSAVGHPSTAQLLSTLLGVEVPTNRVSISIQAGDTLVVFQLGIRLAEGQILSAEEVQDLYDRGLASFFVVEILEG